MADKLLEEFEHQLDEVILVPGRGGVFEVEADTDLIYSKLETGRHAEYDDVAVPLRAALG